MSSDAFRTAVIRKNRTMIPRSAWLGLVWLAVSAVPAAGPLDASLDAWRAGEHARAIAAWQRLAEQGDPEATLFLGYIHRNGLGVARDDATAAHWYRKAAEMGQPEAQYELALMYELGLGVPQDPGEATLWYGLSSGQACPSELSAGGRLGDR